MRFSRTTTVLVGAAIIATVSGGATFAASTIGSRAIQNDSIMSRDIHNGTIGTWDLNDSVRASLDAVRGKATRTDLAQESTDRKDADSALQADVAKKADKADLTGTLKNVEAGADYTHVWVGDNGASLQTARGECPAGEYAVGGGFSTWGGDKDLGGDNKSIQITVSAPYFEGEYQPISETDSNFRPTEWVIKGYNNGDTDQIVRPWVVCADASK